MKINVKILVLLLGFSGGIRLLAQPSTNPVIFYNNGANISIKTGATVFVNDASVQNATGQLDNAGTLLIEGNFINDANATGSGTSSGVYEVKGNWQNNATFQADQSHVKLNAPFNQLITGTQVTSFYDLSIDSATIKTQTLDAFTTNILSLNDAELATDINRMTVSNDGLNAITRTTGFVSSLGGGQLIRNTNLNSYYLFPVGSSLGTVRYRPVFIQPENTTANSFGVRMANTDATAEAYDRNIRETDICLINPNYYHRLYHNAGNANANIRFVYDILADGDWERVSHWQNVPQWEKQQTTTAVWNGMNYAQLTNWGNYNSSAFALSNLEPIIDTTNLDVKFEYCGPTGYIKGIIIRNVMSGTTYNWSGPSGVILTGIVDNNGNIPDITNLTAGVYTLTINKPNGCNASMSFTVDFVPTFTHNIITSDVKCFGTSSGAINLQVFGGFNPFAYNWSNGVTTQDNNNVPAGTYVVTIRDEQNCVKKDTVVINQPPKLVAEIDFTPETCEQSNATAVVVPSGGVPGYTYTWNTTPEQYGPDISGVPAGNYQVQITDANGCKLTKFANINNIATPIAFFDASIDTSMQVILSNATVSFNNQSQYANSYQWSFGDGFTSNVKNPEHTYGAPGDYLVILTAYNSVGCSDEYALGPFHIVPNGALYFPNVFTPNGDGRNDEFMAVGQGVAIFRMTIFDRWGKEIVTYNSIYDRWDGKSKGQDCPEGVYTYVVYYRLNNDAEKKMGGTITLIR